MEAHGTKRIGRIAAILTIALVVAGVLSPSASGGRSITLARAEKVAREAVLAHRSYRQITDARTGLVARGCWRAPRRAARCSLYLVVPNPCALGDDRDGICAQALWERRWLVEAKPSRQGVRARILKISSGPFRASL